MWRIFNNMVYSSVQPGHKTVSLLPWAWVRLLAEHRTPQALTLWRPSAPAAAETLEERAGLLLGHPYPLLPDQLLCHQLPLLVFYCMSWWVYSVKALGAPTLILLGTPQHSVCRATNEVDGKLFLVALIYGRPSGPSKKAATCFSHRGGTLWVHWLHRPLYTRRVPVVSIHRAVSLTPLPLDSASGSEFAIQSEGDIVACGCM
jgi:hypothetical protein